MTEIFVIIRHEFDNMENHNPKYEKTVGYIKGTFNDAEHKIEELNRTIPKYNGLDNKEYPWFSWVPLKDLSTNSCNISSQDEEARLFLKTIISGDYKTPTPYESELGINSITFYTKAKSKKAGSINIHKIYLDYKNNMEIYRKGLKIQELQKKQFEEACNELGI